MSERFQKRIISVGNNQYSIVENDLIKVCQGPDYNYSFSKTNGFFARWGRRKSHNPSFSPCGPELLDVEIETSCNGINGKICQYCYKSNTPNGTYMPFATYKDIFKKFPASTCQIAFGVSSQCNSNPDCWDIFNYTRENGVIPNVTVAQIDDETAMELARVMGAVSVTAHEEKEVCYNSIRLLAQHALETKVLKQINIHVVVSKENEKFVYDILKDSVSMPFVNSVVLLALKQKGRGTNFTPLNQEEFQKLVKYAFKIKARMGFDSCNCHRFLECVKDHPNYKNFKLVAEPCESSCFSLYLNVLGGIFPCSFIEKTSEWENGINLLNVVDFQKEVWYSSRIEKFRRKLIRNKRQCPVYKI